MSDNPPEFAPELAPELADDTILFSAVLQPSVSLSASGFFFLMAALCAVSFGAGTAFLLAGAWPVLGFFGLDILLIYLAFHISYRRARRYETVRLTENRLAVEKIDPKGRAKSWEFQPYWLRVAVDDTARSNAQLTLSSHGKTLEIGAFLSPGEKRDMARALDAELRRLRGQGA